MLFKPTALLLLATLALLFVPSPPVTPTAGAAVTTPRLVLFEAFMRPG